MISTNQQPNSLSTLKDLYDREWSAHFERGHEDFGDLEQALEFLNLTAALDPEHSILEIGGGIGKLSNTLREAGYINIICTDISSVSIEYGRARYPNLDLRLMDACNLTFGSESFDRCLSFDLLEHLPDVDAHLREVYRVLKPGGVYLFQTPNILTNSIHETIKTRGFRWREYHPSLQHSSGLRRKLQRIGFADVSFLVIPPLSKYKLTQVHWFVAALIRLIPWGKLPLSLQVGFWTVARKSGQPA